MSEVDYPNKVFPYIVTFYLIKSATAWNFLPQRSFMKWNVCHWKQKSGYDISEKLVKDRWHGFTQHHTCSLQVQHDTKQT